MRAAVCAGGRAGMRACIHAYSHACMSSTRVRACLHVPSGWVSGFEFADLVILASLGVLTTVWFLFDCHSAATQCLLPPHPMPLPSILCLYLPSYAVTSHPMPLPPILCRYLPSCLLATGYSHATVVCFISHLLFCSLPPLTKPTPSLLVVITIGK